MKKFKISFCTVCMNRLHHLRQTLPANIRDNMAYAEIEFVLLDYNSSDGLENYVRNELSDFVDRGILIYFRTPAPLYFRRAHSRNVAFKLATGDIICNLDADNFTGENFAFYINEVFQASGSICLNTLGNGGILPEKDVLGRICVRKDEFIDVTGFDELMDTYGFEDFDLIYRLEKNGVPQKCIEHKHHLTAIRHGDDERIKKEYITNTLRMVLLNYIDESTTHVVFIHIDSTFKIGTIVDNHTISSQIPKALQQTSPPLRFRYTIKQPEWIIGKWSGPPDEISLETDDSMKLTLKTDGVNNYYYDSISRDRYYPIVNKEMLETIIFFNSEVSNRMKMEKNMNSGDIRVNRSSFGEAVVFKNFDYQLPISI